MLFEQIRHKTKERDEASEQGNNDVEVGELKRDTPDILGHFVAGQPAWQTDGRRMGGTAVDDASIVS